MSSQKPAVSLERIDHGVLPSNDLRLWSSFVGARLGFHANLNVRGLNRKVPMIVFFTVANYPGFGLALQDYRLSPAPVRPMEGVIWGFEVADNDLSAAAIEAQKQKIRWERFTDYSDSSPFSESRFVIDPDGNTIELCHRKHPSDVAPQPGRFPSEESAMFG